MRQCCSIALSADLRTLVRNRSRDRLWFTVPDELGSSIPLPPELTPLTIHWGCHCRACQPGKLVIQYLDPVQGIHLTRAQGLSAAQLSSPSSLITGGSIVRKIVEKLAKTCCSLGAKVWDRTDELPTILNTDPNADTVIIQVDINNISIGSIRCGLISGYGF